MNLSPTFSNLYSPPNEHSQSQPPFSTLSSEMKNGGPNFQELHPTIKDCIKQISPNRWLLSPTVICRRKISPGNYHAWTESDRLNASSSNDRLPILKARYNSWNLLDCRPIATSWSVRMGDQCIKLINQVFVEQRLFPRLLTFYHHLEFHSQSIKPTVERLSYIFYGSSIGRDLHLLIKSNGPRAIWGIGE